MDKWYVYVVGCRGNTLYTGIARDVCKRLRQHAEKSPQAARYTKSHPIEELAGLWRAADKQAAARLEYAFKRLTREEKLQLLARPERLPQVLPQLEAEQYTHLPGVTLAQCLEGGFHDD